MMFVSVPLSTGLVTINRPTVVEHQSRYHIHNLPPIYGTCRRENISKE